MDRKTKRRLQTRAKLLGEPKAKQRWFETSWFRAVELVGIVVAVAAVGFEVHQRVTVDRPVAEATLREIQANAVVRTN